MPLPALGGQDERPWFSNRFVLLPHPPILHGDVPFGVGDAVLVVSSVMFQPDGTLGSIATPQPLTDWEED